MRQVWDSKSTEKKGEALLVPLDFEERDEIKEAIGKPSRGAQALSSQCARHYLVQVQVRETP
jgi:hypothetical protein